MTNMQKHGKQLRPVLHIRIFVYDFLRRAFLQEPSLEYLKALLDNIEDFPFTEESETIAQGIRLVTEYVKNHNVFDEEIYDRLHWDYTRMFIGPDKLPAPPWESVYLTEERLLFQETTLQVRREYAKYGFLPRYPQEADDHLGLELDFMYQLACMAVTRCDYSPGLAELLDDSREFLERHLLNWVPALAQDVRQNADTSFYQGMADILDGYLKLDLQILSELIHTERS